MFSRSLRAETRSRAKEDLKRVTKTNCRVRCWEKKWVAIKDTSMQVYKWVPSLNVDVTHCKKPLYPRQPIVNPTGLLSSYGAAQKSNPPHANQSVIVETESEGKDSNPNICDSKMDTQVNDAVNGDHAEEAPSNDQSSPIQIDNNIDTPHNSCDASETSKTDTEIKESITSNTSSVNPVGN